MLGGVAPESPAPRQRQLIGRTSRHQRSGPRMTEGPAAAVRKERPVQRVRSNARWTGPRTRRVRFVATGFERARYCHQRPPAEEGGGVGGNGVVVDGSLLCFPSYS